MTDVMRTVPKKVWKSEEGSDAHKAVKVSTRVLWKTKRSLPATAYIDGKIWNKSSARIEPTFVITEVAKSLRKIPVDQQLADRTLAFVADVAFSGSSVPSVCLGDDDSVALHWISGPVTIDVEVGRHGPIYVWGVDEDGRELFAENEPEKIRTFARRLNLQIEKRLNKFNPDWRSKYPRQ